MARPIITMSAGLAAALAIVAPAMTLVHTVGRLDTRPSLNSVCVLGTRTATTFISRDSPTKCDYANITGQGATLIVTLTSRLVVARARYNPRLLLWPRSEN